MKTKTWDLSAAFDTLDLELMCQILEAYGFVGIAVFSQKGNQIIRENLTYLIHFKSPNFLINFF